MPTPTNNASEGSSVPDIPTNGGRDGMPQIDTVTSGGSTPGYSGSLKEAWTAAQQELPQTQGAENKFGTSIMHPYISITHLAAIIEVHIIPSTDF